MSINTVTVSGNLAADAELKSTQSGTAVLHFRLAVNERVRQADGSFADRTNWVGCAMFGERAERLAQYLTKGKKVAVSGRLHYSEWERDGERRSRLEVIVSDLDFMSSGQQAQQPAPAVAYASPEPQQAPYRAQTSELRNAQTMVETVMRGAKAVPEPDVYDADIPF